VRESQGKSGRVRDICNSEGKIAFSNCSSGKGTYFCHHSSIFFLFLVLVFSFKQLGLKNIYFMKLITCINI